MRKKSIFSLAAAISLAAGLWAGLPQKANGQDKESPLNFEWNITPNVETFQMMKYGGHQPSLYTGAMHYSLPVYTYKDPDFEIPVSLDYNYDGYKLAMTSGTVGLGWFLNCGGSVTREIRGYPDELHPQTVYAPCLLGDYYEPYHGYATEHFGRRFSDGLAGPGWIQDCLNLFGAAPVYRDTITQPVTDDWCRRKPIMYDASPDLYHFNVLGYRGDFTMGIDGKWHVFNTNVPLDAINVDMAIGNTGTHRPIITINLNGYSYVFGEYLNQIEYSLSEFRNEGDLTRGYPVDAWHLSRIIAPNGKEAVFSYAQKCQVDVTYDISFHIGYHYVGMEQVWGRDPEGHPEAIPTSTLIRDDNSASMVNGIVCSYRCPLIGFSIDGVGIGFDYEQKTKNEYCQSAFRDAYDYYFQYGPFDATMQKDVPKRLSGIIIDDPADTLILAHRYTSDDSSSPKMFLSSISDSGTGTHTFEYNNDAPTDRYPQIGCLSSDHWGYWNGYDMWVGNNPKHYLIPVEYADQQDESLYNLSILLSRGPNYTNTKYGALIKITYPTGGWTSVEYEQNSASQRLDRDYLRSNGWCFLDYNPNSFPAGGIRVRKITDNNGVASSIRTYTYTKSLTDERRSGIIMKMPRYMLTTSFQGHIYLTGSSTNTLTGFAQTVAGTVTGVGNTCNIGLAHDGHIAYSAVQEHHPDGSVVEYKFNTYEDWPDAFDYVDNNYHVRKDIITCSADTLNRNIALTLPPNQDFSTMRGRQKSVTWFDVNGQPMKKIDYSWDFIIPVETDLWCNTLTSFVQISKKGISPYMTQEKTTEYYDGEEFVTRKDYTYNRLMLTRETISDNSGNNGYSVGYQYADPGDRFGGHTLRPLSGVTNSKFFNGITRLVKHVTGYYSAGNPYPTRINEYVINTEQTTQSGRSLITEFTYDNGGLFRLTRADLPGGRYVRFTWDQNWNKIVTKEENATGWNCQYTWDGMYKLTGITEPSGLSATYEYDSGNRLKTIKDGNGCNTEEYEYNFVNLGPDDFNYVRKKTYTSASGDYVRDISYYDGLGYNLLDVSFGAGGSGRSLAKPYVLDPMRRTDAKDFLPVYFEGLTDSQMTPDYVTPASHATACMLYYNDTRPYTETVYGSSPVGKPESIQKPGGVFLTAGKRSTITRRVPDPQQEDIWGIDYDRTSSLSNINFNVYQFMWVQGDLLCECTVDEDGKKTEVFTDRFGKTILERKWNGTEKLDTYYVYDLKDQLVCVMQPEGSKDVWQYGAANFSAEDLIAKRYCFIYVYDDDGTLIRKRIPGGCWQDYIYDERQRVLLYTDEQLLENDAFIRYKYDDLDRVTSEILVSASAVTGSDPAQIRADILFGAAGTLLQYMPVLQTLRECKYWGDTGFASLGQGGMASITGATFLKGQLAQEKVWEAPSADGTPVQNPICTTRKFAYDYRGRLIYTTELDNLGWNKTVNTTYDFTGNVTSRTESIAKVGGMTPNTNSEQWTYDNRGRVLTYTHSYNNSLKASVSYQYDEFGRLKKKVYDGGKASEDFTWNLQGWNTGKQAKWGSSLIFSEDLKYYNPVKDTTLALYSGNISEAATKQQTGQLATNSYSYDGVGRLTNALLLLGDSQNPVTYNGMRNIQYDRNGNLTSNQTTDMGFNKLQSFSHNGNRLTSLLESFPQSTRPSSSGSFGYDARGNMTSDGRKGLLISYNILNLPEKVVKTDSTDMATFRYLYDGTKVAAVRSDGTSIRYQGAFVIDCSTTGFPSTIKSIAWADGVCAAKDGESGFGDYLNVKDHLGNVRDIVALYSASTTPVANANVEKSDYLPFGQRISDITSQYASNQFSGTSSTHRWHLGTKEEVPEGGLNLLDFGARYYDPVLCRWTAVDPMAEKYYTTSPFAFCNNDIINCIDESGKDYFVFDSTGVYIQRVECEGEHMIAYYQNSDNDPILIHFADPENDSNSIINGEINKLVVVSEDEILMYLNIQGAFSSSYLTFIEESIGKSKNNTRGSGRFDYAFSVLNKYYSSNGARQNLYLPEGESMAHNYYNFGNYLWGATGAVVGYPQKVLEIGANINSLFGGKTNGYPAQLDSEDDQRSIIQGYRHIKRKQ